MSSHCAEYLMCPQVIWSISLLLYMVQDHQWALRGGLGLGNMWGKLILPPDFLGPTCDYILNGMKKDDFMTSKNCMEFKYLYP